MDVSNLYIPNVENWMNYYKDVAMGKSNLYNTSRGLKQRGGNITGSSSEFMIPIPRSTQKPSTSDIDLKLVSPVQQIVEQAKSEINRSKASKRKHYQNESHFQSKRQRKQTLKKKSRIARKSKNPNHTFASKQKTLKGKSKRKSTQKKKKNREQTQATI